ncbi:MAG: contact-dependent growth inhibition system immunity protein [Dehalococcoidia bacterium]
MTKAAKRQQRAPASASLRRMLDGYFHQDFLAEHGSLEGAARAFRREAEPAERARAARQLAAAIEQSADVDELRALFASHRSGWRPRSLASARDVLAVLEDIG